MKELFLGHFLRLWADRENDSVTKSKLAHIPKYFEKTVGKTSINFWKMGSQTLEPSVPRFETTQDTILIFLLY